MISKLHDTSSTTGVENNAPVPNQPQRKRRKRTKPEDTTLEQSETVHASDPKEKLCRFLAENYVRKEGRFFPIKNPTSAMSATDLRRVAILQIREKFPEIELDNDLWREVYQFAVEEVHSDKSQTVAVWSHRIECYASNSDGLVWFDGSATNPFVVSP